jgi:hypothetical protein
MLDFYIKFCNLYSSGRREASDIYCQLIYFPFYIKKNRLEFIAELEIRSRNSSVSVVTGLQQSGYWGSIFGMDISGVLPASCSEAKRLAYKASLFYPGSYC